MIRISRASLFVLLMFLLANCASFESETSTATPAPTEMIMTTITPEPSTLGAGFRFSTYGAQPNPGPD